MEPKPSPSPYNTPPPVYSEAIASASLPPPTGVPIGAGVASPGMVQPPQQFVMQSAQFTPVQQGQNAGGQPVFIVHGPPPQRIHQANNHYCMTPQQLAAARRRKMIVSIVIVVVCINIIIAVTISVFVR